MRIMKNGWLKFLVLFGCILTLAGAAAAHSYDSRLSEINKMLERTGGGSPNEAARLALEAERNQLATYVPFSVAVAVVGVVIMGGVPLALVVRSWRAGVLDAPSKQAAVAFAAGSLLLIAGTISCLAAGARLAAVSKELDRLYAEPPPSGVEDWDDKFSLEWERNQLEDRLGWFGGMVAIGIVLTVVPGVWAWKRSGKNKNEAPDNA
jgi:hypothetical protein